MQPQSDSLHTTQSPLSLPAHRRHAVPKRGLVKLQSAAGSFGQEGAGSGEQLIHTFISAAEKYVMQSAGRKIHQLYLRFSCAAALNMKYMDG